MITTFRVVSELGRGAQAKGATTLKNITFVENVLYGCGRIGITKKNPNFQKRFSHVEKKVPLNHETQIYSAAYVGTKPKILRRILRLDII